MNHPCVQRRAEHIWATYADLPSELRYKVVILAATSPTYTPLSPSDIEEDLKHDVVSPASQHTAALVCLDWAREYRRSFWTGRTIDIDSLAKARWFRWLATVEGSVRLTPVVMLIGGVDASIHVRGVFEPDWSLVHSIYFTSTRGKLRNLHIGKLALFELPSISPYVCIPPWGVPKQLTPSHLSYESISITNTTFESPTDLFGLISRFRHARQFNFQGLRYTKHTRHMHTRGRITRACSIQNVRVSNTSMGLYTLFGTLGSDPRCPLSSLSHLEQEILGQLYVDIVPTNRYPPTIDLECDAIDRVIVMKRDCRRTVIHYEGLISDTAASWCSIHRVATYIGADEPIPAAWWTLVARLPLLREIVLLASNRVDLKTCLEHHESHQLMSCRSVTIRAAYSSVLPQQAGLSDFVVVDPYSLLPTGESWSALDVKQRYHMESPTPASTMRSSDTQFPFDEVVPSPDPDHASPRISLHA